MQIGNEQLKIQQSIMSAKNLYNGKIDGIWGPKTIAAKIKWERSGKFSPAIPNNGFPLSDKGPLPVGVRRLPNGNLTCFELEQKAAKQAEQPKQENQTKGAQQQPSENAHAKAATQTLKAQQAAEPVPATPVVAPTPV